MHWLLSLDAALFHFLNSTIANPFFDWLMPLLSGVNVPWLPAGVLAIPFVLLFGSVRLRACALLMVLVVILGNRLIVDVIKSSINRPRPFVTLKDARLYGKVGKRQGPPQADGALAPTALGHSFPSSHAASTFAAAMVGFVFYGRRAWLLFAVASAIAFSRVYNGVHYPTDITAGAILGTGYAIAFASLLQMVWDFVGKRMFPHWHRQLPDLLDPKQPTKDRSLCLG